MGSYKDDLSSLYNNLRKKGYSARDIGTEDIFREKMKKEENRKQLFDYVNARKDFRIGDFYNYERRMKEALNPQPVQAEPQVYRPEAEIHAPESEPMENLPTWQPEGYGATGGAPNVMPPYRALDDTENAAAAQPGVNAAAGAELPTSRGNNTENVKNGTILPENSTENVKNGTLSGENGTMPEGYRTASGRYETAADTTAANALAGIPPVGNARGANGAPVNGLAPAAAGRQMSQEEQPMTSGRTVGNYLADRFSTRPTDVEEALDRQNLRTKDILARETNRTGRVGEDLSPAATRTMGGYLVDHFSTRPTDVEEAVDKQRMRDGGLTAERKAMYDRVDEAWGGRVKGLVDELIEQGQQEAKYRIHEEASDRKSPLAELTGAKTAGSGLQLSRDVAKATDAQQVIDAAKKFIDRNYAPEDQGGQGEGLTQQESDMRDLLMKRVYNYMVQRKVPKTKAQYILQKAFSGSTMGMLGKMLLQEETPINPPSGQDALDYRPSNILGNTYETAKRLAKGAFKGQLFGKDNLTNRQIEQEALGRYPAGGWANAAAEVGSVAMDLPLMAVTGGIGEAAGKQAMKAATRGTVDRLVENGVNRTVAQGIAQRAAQQTGLRYGVRAAQEAANFAALEATGSAVQQQYNEGEIDPWKVVASAGRGGLTGATMGMLGAGNEAWTRMMKDRAGQKTGRALGYASGLGGRTAVLAGSSVLGQWAENPDFRMEDVDWGSETAHALAMNLGFDILGAVKRYRAQRGKPRIDMDDLHLSDDEIAQLNKAGIRGRNAMEIAESLSEAAPMMEMSEGERGLQAYQENGYKPREDKGIALQSVLEDPRIDLNTKMKLGYLLTGDVYRLAPSTATSEVDVDEDGRFKVETYNSAGQTNETRRFKDYDDAEKYRKKAENTTKRNQAKTLEEMMNTAGKMDAMASVFEMVGKRYGLNRYGVLAIYRSGKQGAFDRPQEAGKNELEATGLPMQKIRTIYNLLESVEKNLSVEEDARYGVARLRSDIDARYQQEEGWVDSLLKKDYHSLNETERSAVDDYIRSMQRLLKGEKQERIAQQEQAKEKAAAATAGVGAGQPTGEEAAAAAGQPGDEAAARGGAGAGGAAGQGVAAEQGAAGVGPAVGASPAAAAPEGQPAPARGVERGREIYGRHNKSEISAQGTRREVAMNRLMTATDMNETGVRQLAALNDEERQAQLDRMPEDVRRLAEDYLEQEDAVQGMREALNEEYRPSLEANEQLADRIVTANGNAYVVELGRKGDRTHRIGVVLAGLDEQGRPVSREGHLLVAPVEGTVDKPRWDTLNEKNALTIKIKGKDILQPHTREDILGRLNAEYDAAFLTLGDDVPTSGVLDFAPDNNPNNVTKVRYMGYDPESETVTLREEETQEEFTIPSDEFYAGARRAQRMPIEAEYAEKDKAYKAEVKARKQAEEAARRQAEAEEKARQEAQRKAEAEARRQAEAEAKRQAAEEKARQEAEEAARRQAEAEEKARQEAEARQREIERNNPIMRLKRFPEGHPQAGNPDYEGSDMRDVVASFKTLGKEAAASTVRSYLTDARKKMDAQLQRVEELRQQVANTQFDDDAHRQEAENFLAEQEAELDRLSRSHDFWNSVTGEVTKEPPGWQPSAPYRSAQRRFKESEMTMEILNNLEPQTDVELAADMLAHGRIRLLPEDYRKETGYSKNEQRGQWPMVASKENGGMTLGRAAEALLQESKDRGLNLVDENDPTQGVNAILAALQEAGTWGQMYRLIENHRIEQADRVYREEQRQMDEERDAYYQDVYHMSYENYLAATEMDKENTQWNEKYKKSKDYLDFMLNFVETKDKEENGNRPDQTSHDGGHRESEPAAEGDGTGGGSEAYPRGIGAPEARGEEPAEARNPAGSRPGEGVAPYDTSVPGRPGTRPNEEGKRLEVEPEGEAPASAEADERPVQGLESYTRQEISDIVRDHVANVLEENGMDAEPLEVYIHGSRGRGDAREDSDLDVVVSYQGKEREDSLFNLLNDGEDPLEIEGIRVDINPIRKEESGTMENYIQKSKKYDEEIAAKRKAHSQATQISDNLSERKGTEPSATDPTKSPKNEPEEVSPVVEAIRQAEQQVDPQPTEKQKEAGNYRKGHVTVDGHEISIENAKGSTRSGVDADGTPWSVTMNNTYGYIRGTKGLDGDHIDVYLSDDPTQGEIYVVDQVDPKTGKFDEHKVMYGFPSVDAAKQAYLSNYSPGWKGLGQITGTSREQFKHWIESSTRKTKPFADYAMVRQREDHLEDYDYGELEMNIRDFEEIVAEGGSERDRRELEEMIAEIERRDKEAGRTPYRQRRDEREQRLDENTARGRQAWTKFATEGTVPPILKPLLEKINPAAIEQGVKALTRNQLEDLTEELRRISSDYDDDLWGAASQIQAGLYSGLADGVEKFRRGKVSVSRVNDEDEHFGYSRDNPEELYPAKLSAEDGDSFVKTFEKLFGKGKVETRKSEYGYSVESISHPYNGFGNNRTWDNFHQLYELMKDTGQATGRHEVNGKVNYAGTPYVVYYDPKTGIVYDAVLTDGDRQGKRRRIILSRIRYDQPTPGGGKEEPKEPKEPKGEGGAKQPEAVPTEVAQPEAARTGAAPTAEEGPSIEATNEAKMQELEQRLTENESRQMELQDTLNNALPGDEVDRDALERQLDALKGEQLEMEAEYKGLKAMNEESDALRRAEEEGEDAVSEPAVTDRRQRRTVKGKTDEGFVGDLFKQPAVKHEVKTQGGEPIHYESFGGLNTETKEFAHVERQFTKSGEFDFTGTNKVESADDVAYIFRSLENKAIENSFVLLVKDGKPTVLHLGMGHATGTIVDRSPIFPAIQKMGGVDKIYFIHNHPSGKLICSKEDVNILASLKKMFGDKVANRGLIIDTDSGLYGLYNTEGDTTRRIRPGEGDNYPLETYRFDKQVFNPDASMKNMAVIYSSEDVAKLVSTQRLGSCAKVSYLVMNHNLRVTANIHTTYGDLSSDLEGLATEIATNVPKFAGTCVIVYGDFPFKVFDAENLNKRLKEMGGTVILQDVIKISGNHTNNYMSATDEGFLLSREPEESYNRVNDPEEEERQRIADKARRDGTYLMAPNGQPSHLNERQWTEVRTKAFKDFFGDWEAPAKGKGEEDYSKVLDENGEPRVVYHGTKAAFDRFDEGKIGSNMDFGTAGKGFYFTVDRENAENYARNAEGEGKPRVVEAYLNIRNPKTDVRPIELDGSEKAATRFTANARKKGYDGVEAEAGYHVNKIHWYVAFDPQQVMMLPEETRTKRDESLVGLHNISEEKLRKALGLGGLANPSVAVIDLDKTGHDKYGEISLVLPSSLVDKKSGRNAGTWAGDAYTPRFPDTTKQFGDDGAVRFRKDMKSLDLPDGMDEKMGNAFTEYVEVGNSPAPLAYLFLHEKGLTPKTIYKGLDYDEALVNAMKKEGLLDKDVYRMSDEERQKLVDIYVDHYYADWKKQPFENGQTVFEAMQEVDPKQFTEEGIGKGRLDHFRYDVFKSVRDKGEVDYGKMTEEASETLKKEGLQDEFNQWLADKEKEYGVKEMLFGGYTPSGNKKYLPLTLENVSKMMKKEGRAGAESFFKDSPGAARARLTKNLNTLAAIRKAKDRLTTPSEMKDVAEAINKEFYELSGLFMSDDQYDYSHNARLVDVLTSKDMRATAEKYGYTLDDDQLKRLEDFKEVLQNAPTEYFETKFERPVGIEEFAAAVVPDDLPLDLYGRLKDAGLRLVDYKRGDEADRKRALEEATSEEGIRFSIRRDPAPKKTGVGYKVFVLGKDGKLYPPMVANPGGKDTPVGVWLNADAAPVVGQSKTGRLKVKAGGKGTQGGSGQLAYRPGWHLGEIPYALQFNRRDPETGERALFPNNFVWAEVEYADDVDYQDEAMSYGMNPSGKFQHSLAGLPRIPENGSYRYRTNPDPRTDEWVITGAMKVNRILKPSEVDEMVTAAGREPQPRQEGSVTDEQVDRLNRLFPRQRFNGKNLSENALKKANNSVDLQDVDHLPAHTPEGLAALTERIGEMKRILPGASTPVVVKTLQDVLDAIPDNYSFEYAEDLLKTLRKRDTGGLYVPSLGKIFVMTEHGNVGEVEMSTYHENIHQGIHDALEAKPELSDTLHKAAQQVGKILPELAKWVRESYEGRSEGEVSDEVVTYYFEELINTKRQAGRLEDLKNGLEIDKAYPELEEINKQVFNILNDENHGKAVQGDRRGSRENAQVAQRANGERVPVPQQNPDVQRTVPGARRKGSQRGQDGNSAHVNYNWNDALKHLNSDEAPMTLLNLGNPTEALRNGGVTDRSLGVSGQEVMERTSEQFLNLGDLKNLPRTLANPLAVMTTPDKDVVQILAPMKGAGGLQLVGATVDNRTGIVTRLDFLRGGDMDDVKRRILQGAWSQLGRTTATEFASRARQEGWINGTDADAIRQIAGRYGDDGIRESKRRPERREGESLKAYYERLAREKEQQDEARRTRRVEQEGQADPIDEELNDLQAELMQHPSPRQKAGESAEDFAARQADYEKWSQERRPEIEQRMAAIRQQMEDRRAAARRQEIDEAETLYRGRKPGATAPEGTEPDQPDRVNNLTRAEAREMRQDFEQRMEDMKVLTTKEQAKRDIHQEIIERRRYIESGNLEDTFFVEDLRALAKKDKKLGQKGVLQAIPDYIEGTYQGEVTPELQEAAKKVSDWFEEVYNLMAEEGVLYSAPQIQNYVTHIWDWGRSPKEAQERYNNYVNTMRLRSPFTKHRVIPSYSEGKAMGMVPKYDDITGIVTEYGHYATETIANHRMLEFLKGFKMDIEGGKDNLPMTADVIVSDDVTDPMYQRMNHTAFEGYKVLRDIKPLIAPVFGDQRILDHTQMGELANRLTRGIWTTSSLMKKVALSFSFFHHGALTETAIAMLKPWNAAKVIAKNLIWNTVTTGRIPAMQDKAATRDAVRHLVSLGATNDYSTADVQNFTTAIRRLMEDKNIPVAKQLARWIDYLNTGSDKLLWDVIHDGYKVASYKKMADEIRRLARRKGWTKRETEDALDEAGQLVNDTFGGLHFDILGYSPKNVRILRALLLSPDWTLATIRQALSPLGYGRLYDDNSFWQQLAKGGTPAEQMRKKYGRQFWLTAGIFFYTMMNALNAYFRVKDQDEQAKEAEELRKTDPDYRSPYELAYPDGMHWYDYTMPGNTLGQQTHLFTGRYEDGTESYARWGKQFRELPELFFGRDGLSFPGPMIDKMAGKANPLMATAFEFCSGHSLSGWENKDMKDKKGWEDGVARLYMLSKKFLPYSIPTQEDKDFLWLDLVMPSSKGFTPGKASSYFEKAIQSGDFNYVKAVYNACVMNGLDPAKFFNVAKTKIEAEAKAEQMEGIESVQDAMKAYDGTKDLKERRRLKRYMEQQTGAQDYHAISQAEMVEQAREVLNGEDIKSQGDDGYVKLSTAEDILEDYRLKKTLAGLKRYEDSYREALQNDAAAAERMLDQQRMYIEGYQLTSRYRSAINRLKKAVGQEGVNDKETLEEIRRLRKEWADEMEELTKKK